MKGLSLKLKRLKLTPTDVLVLHIDPMEKSADRIIVSLREWLIKNGLKAVPIMILKPGETVQTISETKMRMMGWIRPYEVIK